MNRPRPLDFLTMVTPLLARGSRCAPPRRQETFPHFGFLVSVETRTLAQMAGRRTTDAIWVCSFVVGLRCAVTIAGASSAPTATERRRATPIFLITGNLPRGKKWT